MLVIISFVQSINELIVGGVCLLNEWESNNDVRSIISLKIRDFVLTRRHFVTKGC